MDAQIVMLFPKRDHDPAQLQRFSSPTAELRFKLAEFGQIIFNLDSQEKNIADAARMAIRVSGPPAAFETRRQDLLMGIEKILSGYPVEESGLTAQEIGLVADSFNAFVQLRERLSAQ